MQIAFGKNGSEVLLLQALQLIEFRDVYTMLILEKAVLGYWVD